MLFPSESIVKARRVLFAQMEDGALTREQAFQRALELDPFDAVALVVLTEERLAKGDLAGTAEYAWRAANADPCRFEPWFKLAGCFPQESDPFRDGFLELGALKALRDPLGIEQFEKVYRRTSAAKLIPDAQEALEVMADDLGEKRREEPEEVSRRLRPYRLIDDLLETAGDGLDSDEVDGILEDGERCLPLLIGILRAMASGSLPGDEVPSIVCSLALIGEIGDPAVLPELIECYTVDDVEIQQAAHWAVKRIAARRPEAALEAVRKLAMASHADSHERCIVSMAMDDIPEQPGRRDVLLGLLDGLAAFPKSERHVLFISVAMALVASEGIKGRELAWSLLSRHAAALPKQTRTALREGIALHDEMDRISAALPPDGPAATVYDLCARGYVEDDEAEFEDGEDEGDEDEDEDDVPFDDDEDEDEDEDFVPAPVRRTVTLGRNDPCWCGSGKKYKKCHLESDEKSRTAPAGQGKMPKVATPLGNTTEESDLRRRLIEFATSTLHKREMEEALLTFVGSEPPAGVDDESLTRETIDWLVHDYVAARLGHPIIEEFLKRSPGGLTMRQRKMLEAWRHSRYSLFEVQEVRAGSGVRLKDLLAGGEFFVDDVSTSKRAALWDCYLARVEEFEGRHFFTAIVSIVLQPLVAPLKKWAVGEQRRSGLSWDSFLRAHSHKLRQEYWGLVGRANDSRRVVSYEGDDLVFSRARYAVLDEESVRRALDGSKAMLRGEDPADYGWLDETEDASGGRRAYGHVHIAGGELTLECNSRQRLERGAELLGHLAGEHLRHRGDDFTSWKSAMRDRQDTPKDAGLPPEVEREQVQEWLDEHYRTWPDTPVPALDGKTPREAASSPKSRAQLVDLLKMLENGEEHKRRDGIAWYDVSKLKAELGVEF